MTQAYQVVARRYRPQTFGDLIGQEQVAKALQGAIEQERVGHAYLFTGARGVGKTSCARILAKALNCERGPSGQPCNACDACLRISAGDDTDVLEIDGASNRGIDEMRELRQNVNIRPSRSRNKIYIIDEVHMLTKEAFNALLKTLEEPPGHVKFIFCTTEPEKIPITILSRCQRFDFAGIATAAIVARLRQIVQTEGVAVEPEALQLLARRAAGSMRDSQSLLEQLLAGGGAQVTAADVHALLGTADSDRILRVGRALAAEDAAAALAQLDEAVTHGIEPGQLLEQLLGLFRDVLVLAVGGDKEQLLFTGPAEAPLVDELARNWGVDRVLAMIQLVDHTLGRLRLSVHARILAELALVRLCRLGQLEELSELAAQLRAGSLPAVANVSRGLPGDESKKKTELAPAPAAVAVASQAAAAGRTTPAAPLAAAPSAAAPTSAATQAEDAVRPAEEPAAEFNPQVVWRQALEQLPVVLQTQASACARVELEPPCRLVAFFPQKYASARSYCERPEAAQMLQQALAAAAGRPVPLDLRWQADAAEEARPLARPLTVPERIVASRQHPLVKKAQELFDATPIDVEVG